MSAPVEFSPEALEAFRRQIGKASTDVNAVRLGVKGGACSGLQYVIEFDYGTARATDTEWKPEGCEDLTFRIDKKSTLYLSGSRVTWEKSLMREGFKFENPNEASRCGCGHSFSAK